MSDLNLAYDDLKVGIRRTADKANYEVGVIVGDTFLALSRLGLGHVDEALDGTLEDHAANAAAAEQAKPAATPAPVAAAPASE